MSSWAKMGNSWVRVDSISEIQFTCEAGTPVLRCVMNGMFSEDFGHSAIEKAEQQRTVKEIGAKYDLDPQQMAYDPESGVLRDLRETQGS